MDVKIVENVHVDSAGRMLDTARKITELEIAGTEYVNSDIGNCAMDCLSRLKTRSAGKTGYIW